MKLRTLMLLGLLASLTACVPAVAGGEPAPERRGNILPPEWTPTPTLLPGQSPEPIGQRFCSTAPPSILEDGALVTLEEVNAAGRLFAGPGLGQEQIGLVIPGEALEIIRGPECADHMVWWKVRSLETGLEGWLPEGNHYGRWLHPATPDDA
jgi:hypothetical protein